jgi:nucleolar protein 14
MAKKGSQLKRFKESLSQITRPSTGTKRKRKPPTQDPDRNSKLKQIEESANLFNTKYTRPKYEIAGRKVKGKVGKPAANKEIGETQVIPLIMS